MRIAFIGLGVMGIPMAKNLLEAGHELSLHRVTERSAFLVERGAQACGSPAEAAGRSEIVILMLPNTPDVEQVLFSEQGVAAGLRAGSLVIDMSSISPVETRAFADRIVGLGAEYLDAPVSGGQAGAEEASLTIMAGGPLETFERAQPVLAQLGRSITRIGEHGSGQIAKVANQIIVALTIQAVAEALTFAEQAGVDPAIVREALDGGFASSKILQAHGKRMIEGSYEPGFRMRLHRKDLSLAIEAAQQFDVFLPNTAGTAQLMNAAIAAGLGELDHSALKLFLERARRGDGSG